MSPINRHECVARSCHAQQKSIFMVGGTYRGQCWLHLWATIVVVHAGGTRQPIVGAFFILLPGIEARLLRPTVAQVIRAPGAKSKANVLYSHGLLSLSVVRNPITTHPPFSKSKTTQTVAGLSDCVVVYAILQHISVYVFLGTDHKHFPVLIGRSFSGFVFAAIALPTPGRF